MGNKKISKRRDQLLKRESEIQANIDNQSNKIERIFSGNTKKIAVLAVGIAAGFLIYKSATSSQKKVNNPIKQGRSSKNRVTKNIIAKAVKSLIPYAIEKLQVQKQEEVK